MCGIVGVASSGPMTVQMKELFQSLLFHDVVRGHHATGIAAIDTMGRDLSVEKKALPSPIFLHDKDVQDNLFAHKHNFNIYIGHNRWATSGSSTDDNNAHPFIHGDVVGVHNGSLRQVQLLDNHKDFVVDSDNLFYHLDQNGLNDTIAKTNGAYALVWYDRGDNSLNFVRNDDRPLAIGKLSNGSWVWASEMGMLQWLIKRHKALSWAKYKDKDTDKDVDTVFQLQAFTHMKVDFTGRTMGDVRFTVKNRPTFPTVTYGTHWNQTDYYDSWGNRSDNTQRRSTVVVTTTETDYTRKARECIQKFLTGGGIDSMVEVEFMGHHKERTSSGYEASVSLFKFQSFNGKVVILHSFNHQTCYTREWTDEDIGNRVYGRVAGAIPHNAGSYKCTMNEELGFTLSINDITEVRPNRLFTFCEKADGSSDGKEEGDNSKVVPFRGKIQQETKKIGKKGSGSSVQGSTSEDSSVPRTSGITEEQAAGLIDSILTRLEGDDESEPFKETLMARDTVLANGKLTYGKYLEIFQANNCRCSNCSGKLTNMSLNRIYWYPHFDRSEGRTFDYLSCKRSCHESMVAYCGAIDEDYDKFYGGKDE